MENGYEVSENDAVHESLDSQDNDDSEKTNVTVIDSNLEAKQITLSEPTVTDEVVVEAVYEDEKTEIGIDWELPNLMTDLDGIHGQMKSRIMKELQEIKLMTDSCILRLINQERNSVRQKEVALKADLIKLQEEISDQNKALKHKDEVIKKLVSQIRQQKERVKLAQVFANWRSHEELRKRQAFCSKMATRHSNMLHQRRALIAWKAALETSWKERIQKNCRAKAEEVCIRLATEYEEKTKQLTMEVQRLNLALQKKEEQQQHEKDELRAAVMRGVCALNLETMGVMHDAEEEEALQETPDSPKNDELEVNVSGQMEKNLVGAVARQRVTTGQVLRKSVSGGSGDTSPHLSGFLPRGNIRHRLIAGQDEASRRGNPSAAAAVLVERHHPVNKRTAASVLANHERSYRAVAHPPM